MRETQSFLVGSMSNLAWNDVSASVGDVRTDSITLRRIVIAVVCMLSLVVCCGLAWWQWERYSSAGGTFQNLGYVLQWPLFGLFPLFMAWRIRRLQRQAQDRRQEREAEPEHRSNVTIPARPSVARPPAPPAAMDDEDEELAAYNRYLAELNTREAKGK